MNKVNNIWTKIHRKWIKLRLQPIRVFCFHHVSEIFDESTMKRCDWIPMDLFKREISQMQKEGYEFISLPEAHAMLEHDIFRKRKFAVLTADDGWASIKNVLPWLKEQHIPITLFINPSYLDGKHYREKETEKYLTVEELRGLSENDSLVTIGSHGWEHIETTRQTEEDFCDSVNRTKDFLKHYKNYIPYYAFTYGRYTKEQLLMIRRRREVPILVRGNKNYIYQDYIDRELLCWEYIKNFMNIV